MRENEKEVFSRKLLNPSLISGRSIEVSCRAYEKITRQRASLLFLETIDYERDVVGGR